jgi:hypothetical protein
MMLSQDLGLGIGLSTIIFALVLRLLFIKPTINNVTILLHSLELDS